MLERAGIPVDKILHVHGFLQDMECTACGHAWNIGYKEFDIETDRCPKCSSLKGVKPKIVFFNGQAPMYKYLYRALDYLNNPKSKLIVIGTMGNVIPVDVFTEKIHKSKKILNNLEESPYIDDRNYEHVFYEPASTALPKIEKILEDWNK